MTAALWPFHQISRCLCRVDIPTLTTEDPSDLRKISKTNHILATEQAFVEKVSKITSQCYHFRLIFD